MFACVSDYLQFLSYLVSTFQKDKAKDADVTSPTSSMLPAKLDE